MRHRKIGRKLNCKFDYRISMFRNMTNSLVMYEIIKTTLPKAKELRRIIEPLITLSKIDNISNRRLLFSHTRSNQVVYKLVKDLGPRFKERKGGYTRILKYGFRKGDGAHIAYIEFVK